MKNKLTGYFEMGKWQMRKPFLLLAFVVLNSCSSLNPHQENTKPISHHEFTVLLQQCVDEEGLVDYGRFMGKRDRLTQYLKLLLSNAPNDSNWSSADQIAYWINLYNAATIELILEHYPVRSIKDIGGSIQIPFVNSPWDIKFLKINGKNYDLNNIEHNILRKNWDEPRIHFAINCASRSCPKLRREAYEGQKLEEQLEAQAYQFINDEFRNEITVKEARLSKIFSWFGGDFEKEGDLVDFINQYANQQILSSTGVSYKDYDWQLNEQP